MVDVLCEEGHGRISYQACCDHFLKPFGLSLVVEVDAAHQLIAYKRKGRKDTVFKRYRCSSTISHEVEVRPNIFTC